MFVDELLAFHETAQEFSNSKSIISPKCIRALWTSS